MALRRSCTTFSGRLLCIDGVRSWARAYATVNPSSSKYLTSHQWVRVSGNEGVVGISDFAQKTLGDVLSVDVPFVGKELKKGETLGVVKSMSNIYSPVTGTVTDVNTILADSPANVKSSRFEDGWLVKVKLSNKAELDDLLNAAAYEKHCEAAASC
eukprot:jgi/Chlat1/3185/Chrsp22S00251